MAFHDLDRKRIEKAMAEFLSRRRPPPYIRPELDIGYRLIDQSVELFEIPRSGTTDRSFASTRLPRRPMSGSGICGRCSGNGLT